MHRIAIAITIIGTIALCAHAADEAKAKVKAKKQTLTASFKVPNPSYKANITEVKVVGKELWAKVEVASDGGVAAAVIKTIKATAEVEAEKMPIKYIVYGKTWKWDNTEANHVFTSQLNEKLLEKIEKAYADGKTVYEDKKDDKKEDKKDK